MKFIIKRTKLFHQHLNPLVNTLIFLFLIIYCWSTDFFLLGFVLFFFGVGYQVLLFKKQHWLWCFFLLPLISFWFFHFFFQDRTEVNQKLIEANVRVVKIATNYVIVKWKNQKLYFPSYQQTFIPGQLLKITGTITEIAKPKNSYNFDFFKYLRSEYVFKALKVEHYETSPSLNIRFLFFSWLINNYQVNFVTSLLFRLPGLQKVKSLTNELSLTYILNFSSANLLILGMVFQVCFVKFKKQKKFFKLFGYPFFGFYLFLLDFPLVLSKIGLGWVVKDICSFFKKAVHGLKKIF